MTTIPGLAEPLLVLGLGNQLLSDDGAGYVLLQELSRHADEWGGRVEFLDGGTQGLALLGRIARRRAIVLLDAIQLGAPPGTLHVCTNTEIASLGARRSSTAHEGNAGELLAAAELLGESPEHLVLIGIEPERLTTGIGLSESVAAALPAAIEQARQSIRQLLACVPNAG